LDEAATDRGVLNEKGRGGIAPLDLDHLLLKRVERKATARHLENVTSSPA
jgi:hypothetical protein